LINTNLSGLIIDSSTGQSFTLFPSGASTNNSSISNVTLANQGSLTFRSLVNCNINNVGYFSLDSVPSDLVIGLTGGAPVITSCNFSNINTSQAIAVENTRTTNFSNISCDGFAMSNDNSASRNTLTACNSTSDITNITPNTTISNCNVTGNITTGATGNVITGCRASGTIDGTVGNTPLVVGCWAGVIGANVHANSIGNVP
jgi:hypothetical protein